MQGREVERWGSGAHFEGGSSVVGGHLIVILCFMEGQTGRAVGEGEMRSVPSRSPIPSPPPLHNTALLPPPHPWPVAVEQWQTS